MRVIKAGFSRGGLTRTMGCEKGPDEVLKFCSQIYTSESGRKPLLDVIDVDINQANIETTFENIEKAIPEQFCVMLGGDHSITYAAFKAIKDENAGIVIFDAHADCVNNMSPPSHEDFVKTLIEEGHVKSENVLIVGLRNVDVTESEYLKDKRIRTFPMRVISSEGIREICDTVMESAKQWSKLYISVDIDVLDPAFAPGTGYMEPGGLTTRELIYFLQRLKLLRNLRMVDIVEINPDIENSLTPAVGAKLLCEFC